jgi:4-hydroxy-2-oxoheptanedioate aldolase
MRANALKAKWQAGKGTVNGWCAIPSPFAAEVMAHCGWDSVTIDLQHGLVDYQTALGMLQALSTKEVVPLCRVPWREAGICMKLLDAGAYGIICPMVNTAEQAREFVSFCRYAPMGQRSFGPTRALMYGGADYAQHANDHILTIAMIETTQALENLDAIMATPGLDGIYVGPADLSLSMGYTPRLDPEQPEVLTEIKRIVEAARKHGRNAGIHCGSVEFAKRMLKDGFNFTSMLSDSRLLTMKAVEIVQAMGKDAEGPKSSTY